MAGVSGSLYRFSGPLRFLLGFAFGLLLSSGLLALILAPISIGAHVVNEPYRVALFGAFAILLATLDLAGRTPYMQRQVPQRLGLNGMDPGQLGIVYGTDAGLHVTTQKSTSLIWGGVLGAVLLGTPEIVSAALIAAATGYGFAVATVSTIDRLVKSDISGWGWSSKLWVRVPQIISASILIATVITVVARL